MVEQHKRKTPPPLPKQRPPQLTHSASRAHGSGNDRIWLYAGIGGALLFLVLAFALIVRPQFTSKYSVRHKITTRTGRTERYYDSVDMERMTESGRERIREQRARLTADLKDELYLEVEIRGPADELMVMLLDSENSRVRDHRIYKEDLMDNIERIEWMLRDERGNFIRGAKPGRHTLLIKSFDPEKDIYKGRVNIPEK